MLFKYNFNFATEPVYSYNLHKHTKYKNLIKEISPIDLTDLMKLIFSNIVNELRLL